MIWGYSIYEILWLFMVYGCMGWCLEVAYAALEKGEFVNRGFLNGPICPIYGVGAVTVILCLTPISHNVWLLFAGGALLTSALELVTGFALDKMFRTRWWDYTDTPFNLGGYICLKFSVVWGLVCIALMKGINPVVYGFVHKLSPHLISVLLLIFLLAVLVSDVTVTFVTVNKLAKRVRLMDDIAKKIRTVSDEMGAHIYEGVEDMVEKHEEFKAKRAEEEERLKERYAELEERPHMLQRRILKAFPGMKSKKYEEQLSKLKERISIKNKRK